MRRHMRRHMRTTYHWPQLTHLNIVMSSAPNANRCIYSRVTTVSVPTVVRAAVRPDV
jgi:hypothetical protein